jgi:hypothetical protein
MAEFTNAELGAKMVSPCSDINRVYNSPISKIVPVFPKTVILSPILNGRVSDRYNPAIILPITVCEAKARTKPATVVIDAAKNGSLLRYERIMAANMIAVVILTKAFMALAFA